MLKRIRLIATLGLLTLASSAFAITPDEAATAVTTRYRITTPGFLGDFKEIGSSITPRREGLRADRPSNAFRPNVIKGQQLVVPGGGDLPLGSAHTGILKAGERLHLYGVSSGTDYVQLDLRTVATYVITGIRGPQALQASVRFQFDGGLAGVSSQQLLTEIGAWLQVENAAPAAPAVERTTSSIHRGQSLEEVKAIFGPPDKQILLGAKTVCVYGPVKVIFVDGKVVDAE